MATNKQFQTHDVSVKVETLTLDDGRRAERHIVLDDNGNEVVEIFAEEKRPLKLEKRIVREFKNIVAKETHQSVRDGEVILEEVHSQEPEVPLQLRSRVGVADHAKVVDGDYVRKEEVSKLIADGVVAGVSALMEQMEPVVHQPVAQQPVVVHEPVARPEPVFKAQAVVEKNVEEKKKNDMTVNVIMGVIIVLQLAFFGYLFLV